MLYLIFSPVIFTKAEVDSVFIHCGIPYFTSREEPFVIVSFFPSRCRVVYEEPEMEIIYSVPFECSLTILLSPRLVLFTVEADAFFANFSSFLRYADDLRSSGRRLKIFYGEIKRSGLLDY